MSETSKSDEEDYHELQFEKKLSSGKPMIRKTVITLN